MRRRVCAGAMAALLPGCLWFEAIRGPSGTDAGTGADTGTAPAAASGCSVVPGLDDAKAPVIFFSDLVQGPSTGGVGGNGVFLTLYGLRFGSKGQGDRVLIGGTEVVSYTAWNPSDAAAPDDRFRPRKLETITVQPGAAIQGDALDVIIIAGGRASNAVKFGAKPSGTIWFVDSTYAGADSDGSASKPFTRLDSVKRTHVNGGDVVYLKGTFTDRDPERPGEYDAWVLSAASRPITTQDAPVAYVGFPGSPPLIGGTGSVTAKHALLLDDGGSGEGVNHLVFANLLFALAASIQLEGNDLRFVGNKLFAFPTSAQGAIEIGDASKLTLLGNYFRNLNLAAVYSASKLSTADVAFNEVYLADGGFSFDPPPVPGISGLRVFDNLFARVNFLDLHLGPGVSSGAAFNNIFVNNGTDTFDLGVDRAGSPLLIANNTLIHVVGGLREDGTPSSSSGTYQFRSNAIALRDDRSDYVNMGSGGANGFSAADHNVYAPKSGGTAVVSNLETDARIFPSTDALLLTNASLDPIDLDFTPLAQSPLLDQGADTGLCGDYFGIKRPMGAGFDVGAVERP